MFLMIILTSCREDFSNLSLNHEKTIQIDTRIKLSDNSYLIPELWYLTAYMYNNNLYITGFDMNDSVLKTYNSTSKSIEFEFDCSKNSEMWTLTNDDELLFFIAFKPDSILLVSYNNFVLFNGNKILRNVKRETLLGKYYFISSAGSDNYKDYIQDKIPFIFGGDFHNPSKQYRHDFKMFGLFDPKEFTATLFPAKNPNFFDMDYRISEAGCFVKNNKIYVRFGMDSSIYVLNDEFELTMTNYRSPKPPIADILAYDNYNKDSLQSVRYKESLILKHASSTIYSDVFPIKDTPYSSYFRFVPKIYAKRKTGERRRYLVYLDILNYDLEVIKSIKVSNGNFGYPPHYSEGKYLFYTLDENRPIGIYEYFIMNLTDDN